MLVLFSSGMAHVTPGPSRIGRPPPRIAHLVPASRTAASRMGRIIAARPGQTQGPEKCRAVRAVQSA